MYGAIDPTDTVMARLGELETTLQAMDDQSCRPLSAKRNLLEKLALIRRHLAKGLRQPALDQIAAIRHKVDGCAYAGAAEGNDWITTCGEQQKLYWAMHELEVLLKAGE